MEALIAYETFLDQDKEEFSRCVRLLLNQTFILETKFNKNKNMMENTKEYYFIDKHFMLFEQYFFMMGYELERYDKEGILYLKTNGRQIVHLKEDITKMLLIIKLLYEEKIRSITLDSTVYISFFEIKQKVDVFKLFDKALSPNALSNIFKELSKYQLIEYIIQGSDEGKIIVYPSIRYILINKDITEILSRWKGEEANEDIKESPIS
ncbi:DUF4194 domain-containing protein [Beduini massiliensis]|uniref:DUF4194 domain-containing protein n=1 Tax=Beduini massiliensis TaxID=1585974 RepID=UPI00059A920C|nr:DUF4194 domain-containing protein [Beduini massiliensis]